MRDKMKIGDQVSHAFSKPTCLVHRAPVNGSKCFFYHSNCKVPGIAGIAEVVREGYTDCKHFLFRVILFVIYFCQPCGAVTAFDVAHPYYDPKSDPDSPKWMMVVPL